MTVEPSSAGKHQDEEFLKRERRPAGYETKGQGYVTRLYQFHALLVSETAPPIVSLVSLKNDIQLGNGC